MKRLILILILALLIMPISLVHASDDESVNLGDVPQKLADALNIGVPAAQLLSCAIVLMLCLFPTLTIAGYFGGSGAAILSIFVVGLPVSGFLVYLGWFPAWLFILMFLGISLLFGSSLRNWISGKGGE